MFSVRGKSAIVTGASSGISLAFAGLLLSKGCNVVVADLSRGLGEDLYTAFPHQARFKKCDVTNWRDWDDAFTYARKEFGGVQIVTNGAGIFEPHWSNFWHNLERDSYKTLDINLAGTIHGTRLAIREIMRQRQPGVILNITSIAAQLPRMSTPIYAASKAAVSAFTRSLAELHNDFDVKVVAVAPGVVKTPLWTDHPEKTRLLTDNDKWVTAEETAQVMLDLVQEEKYPGGTIVESSLSQTRIVRHDSPLPSGDGTTVSNEEAIIEEAREILRQERDGS